MLRAATNLAFASTVLSLSLTQENFVDMTQGKNVFIKFFAPWCGHCKAIKQDWETLMNNFANDPQILVAEVDCTEEASLCAEQGVEGYPTIRWGTLPSLQEYEGERSLEELMAFAKEIGPTCSISTIQFCSKEERELIDKQLALSDEDLDVAINRNQAILDAAEEEFEKELGILQDQFEKLENAKKSAEKAVKDAGHRTLVDIKEMRARVAAKKEL